MLDAVEQINMTNAYVISADINSGINGDTGVCGTAVNSDLTVSIGSFKTGMFLNDAPYYIGSMTNCDIGINLIEEEYKLIDYSLLHMFEGYGSLVMTTEEFFKNTATSLQNAMLHAVLRKSAKRTQNSCCKNRTFCGNCGS